MKKDKVSFSPRKNQSFNEYQKKTNAEIINPVVDLS